MSRNVGWKNYVSDRGDFEFPKYLYNSLTSLMKISLDLGTLLSNDPAKLRAFKEQIKQIFKKRWFDIAEALEFFDVIVPCGCEHSEYCGDCGGSRYALNSALSPDRLREISFVLGPKGGPGLMEKLEAGLQRALDEVGGEM